MVDETRENSFMKIKDDAFSRFVIAGLLSKALGVKVNINTCSIDIMKNGDNTCTLQLDTSVSMQEKDLRGLIHEKLFRR